MYVEDKREIEPGKWLVAHCGPLYDENHVKCSKFGKLSLRPGFHSTTIPWTNWIGTKMPDGSFARRTDNVWCECEVDGQELIVTQKNGLRTVPNGYYYFKTNSKQTDPWIISGRIKVNRILTNTEVAEICRFHGVQPQPIAV